MDKIKTIVINEGQMTQDTGTTELSEEYVEVIPKNYIARYLKINLDFRNYRKAGYSWNPVIKINGELCPIPFQKSFEIRAEDEFNIESLMINDNFYIGDITMILVNYNSKIK